MKSVCSALPPKFILFKAMKWSSEAEYNVLTLPCCMLQSEANFQAQGCTIHVTSSNQPTIKSIIWNYFHWDRKWNPSGLSSEKWTMHLNSKARICLINLDWLFDASFAKLHWTNCFPPCNNFNVLGKQQKFFLM